MSSGLMAQDGGKLEGTKEHQQQVTGPGKGVSGLA